MLDSILARSLLLGSLLGTGAFPAAPPPAPSGPAAPATEPAPAPAGPRTEAFGKGPVTLSAKVTRTLAGGERVTAPLFALPVLAYRDQLDLAFAGEAFDPRVTRADWSLVVVFLPRTIAPTDQGVVDLRLKRGKDGRMGAAPITVPYDSIPMLFLVPDSNGRKKVLKDLNDHLEKFRTLCAKIAELSSERAVADGFLHDLEAIDKDLSPAQYDNALLGFVHAYGDQVSTDLQAFLSGPNSNLAKCQFLTQEFRRTNVLVPAATPSGPAVSAMVGAGTGGDRPICAYVSIFFDLAAIIHNLWPGHQFQYLPALARNFRGVEADLFYGDWIHTTGEVRGALMCCPGSWEAQAPPDFTFGLAAGESLLGQQALLAVHPKERSGSPFGLYGRDWRLLLTGPDGQALAPVPLDPSPGRKAFVARPGAAQEALRQRAGAQVQARIAGRWGFTSLAAGPVQLRLGCDPAWSPTAAERAGFQAGRACAFRFPGSWAGAIERVRFRPDAPGAAPLDAVLAGLPDGGREARFEPGPDSAGPGTLEVVPLGSGQPALARPLALLPADPEPAGLEARLGDTAVRLRGRNLQGVEALEFGTRRFRPAPAEGDGGVRVFRAEDGQPLAGTVGRPLAGFLVTARGRRPLPPAALLPARPRLGAAQVLPVAVKDAGLPVTAPVPIAPTGGPSQVNLLAGPGYRFPADGGFRIALRNPEQPGTVRTLDPAAVRVMGHNLKAAFTLLPSAVLGGGASGRLEVQVRDPHAGDGDWIPLPATFLDLPAIGSVRAVAGGFRLAGPSLDQIEAVAPGPGGPWLTPAIRIEEGREVAQVDAPLAGDCCLKLFGWPDLVLTVRVPAQPEAGPGNPAAGAPQPVPAAARPVTARPDAGPTHPGPAASHADPAPPHPEPTAPHPEPTPVRPEPLAARPEPATLQPEPATPQPAPAPARQAAVPSRPAAGNGQPAPAPGRPGSAA